MVSTASTRFFWFCGICALLSAVTTLGVHLLFEPPTVFEEQVQLFRNPRYLFRCVWVIGHCLLVLLSGLGVALKRWAQAPGWLLAGLLGFVVFALTEIFRMTLTLTYLNPLREKYVTAGEPLLRTALRAQLEAWAGVNTGLFLVFFVAFGLGNLFYGLALWRRKAGRADQWLGGGLLLWAGLIFWGFLNRFYPTPVGSWVAGVVALTVQPALRVALGWWLLRAK